MPRNLIMTLAIVGLVAIVLATSFVSEYLPLGVWRQSLAGNGLAGALAFLIFGVLATSVGFPRQLIAGVAGYAYGLVPGLFLSLLAAVGGCTLTVLAARWFLAGPVNRHFEKQVDWLRRATRGDTAMKIIAMRLQPLGTNLTTNLAAGVIGLRLPVFLGASAIGYIPQLLIFALVGSGVAVGSQTELVVAAVLFVVSLILAAVLWRRHRVAAHARD